ncbi:hypothetical protein KFE80_02990 [bacterium SCSIO 12696]|nr:hypothetical protein KFE80_02990 [bacterium SCSIO 12696]
MKSLTIVILTAAFVVGAFFLFKPEPAGNGSRITPPWNIAVHEDGSSSVFGIQLGETQFVDAAQLLGWDREVAVLIGNDDIASLEMYYSRFHSGAFTGKLVVASNASPQIAAQLAEQSAGGEYLGTGSRRFDVELSQLDSNQELVVKTLSFIPTINLDEEIIEGRFGKATEIIKLGDSRHFLYPEKGLDIALNPNGKETLQYIAPKHFHLLRQPLIQQQLQQQTLEQENSPEQKESTEQPK